MTVRDLIEALQPFPENYEIMAGHANWQLLKGVQEGRGYFEVDALPVLEIEKREWAGRTIVLLVVNEL